MTDTIAAVATPPGFGGIGIVRLSGPAAARIAEAVIGPLPAPRFASFRPFLDSCGEVIDEGIALFFAAPHSFTGEDVVELQGHGGPVVSDLLLQRVLGLGARLARPGEFSERAFCNGRLDLAQAEAIADLIESGSAAAARLASRSLQGEFSRRVHHLVDELGRLRSYVEAGIDFPDDELDLVADSRLSQRLEQLLAELERVRNSAQTGRLLRDGISLVIAGPPNAGKSSLLNALVGRDCAIVTDVPGTTRDLLRERIQIDGIPLHLVDTAGMRESSDRVELEGIRRARDELGLADHILWVFDDLADPRHRGLDQLTPPPGVPLTLVRNKIDASGTEPGLRQVDGLSELALSARTGAGVDLLREHLKTSVGYQGPQEGEFIARRRHINALDRASECLLSAREGAGANGAAELVAEDLRQAQRSLSEITGEFTSDDLLDQIFRQFCIGK